MTTDLTNLDPLITEWQEAERNRDYWVQKEKELRQQIFGTAFPAPTEGTNKARIGHGMALIGDWRMNYKIDRAAMEASRGFIPADVFDAVVNYRPEIRDGAFRKLEPDQKKLFGPFVTVTPGTPGLELKPQNKVRW